MTEQQGRDNRQEPVKEKEIHFYTLNVGQGDSHVIHFPRQEAAVVIDPGNGILINQLLHDHLAIKHLPLILITHFHYDHMAGINSVIRACLPKNGETGIKLGYLYFSDDFFTKSKKCRRFDNLLNDFHYLVEKYELELEHKIKPCHVDADDPSAETFTRVLEGLGIKGRIIYPKRLEYGKAVTEDKENLASVLLYLAFSGKKILYSADLSYKGWEKVFGHKDLEPGELKSDVFKVPHHGGWISNTSGEDMGKILEQVDPKFALVSVGNNKKHRHPFPQVIKAIVDHNSKPTLFCTQMSDKCMQGAPETTKAQILDHYNRSNMIEEDKKILLMGSDNGTPCAGTVRISFHKNEEDVETLPAQWRHMDMLKSLFDTGRLLCGARFCSP